MRIAQIAPLTEAIPPKLYGGTERVISWLTDGLVALGHEVVLFASGGSRTPAKLQACWPKALRLDGSVRDPNALHMAMLEQVRRQLRPDRVDGADMRRHPIQAPPGAASDRAPFAHGARYEGRLRPPSATPCLRQCSRW